MHVLEMLAADDRDWSLTEIIDRIRGVGIQAHDDAVRSITIKLMKDGRVERVGRGQYRLARRGSARPVTSTPAVETPAEEPVTDDVQSSNEADGSPVDDFDADAPVEATDHDAPVDIADHDAPVDIAEQAAPADEASDESVDQQPEPAEEPVDEPAAEPAQETRSYTPPLNLGQPWG